MASSAFVIGFVRWVDVAHYERLTATDTTFLRIETPHEPQHVGSLAVLEGAPLRDETGRIRFDELRDRIAGRLHRVPRLRQRIMEVPLGQGRPVWVDDSGFDIDYHVRLTALPRPGDDEQLATLMGRLQSLALDRSRPLWEMWFVDGLVGDRMAMIIKTHHSLGDGIANVDLALALVDLEPEPPHDDEPPAWRPRAAPSAQRLLIEQLSRPAHIAESMLQAVANPRPVVEATVNVARTVIGFAAKPDPAPWNLPVSPHRRWVHADVSFDAVRQARERTPSTVNDVVLAACTGALRQFLIEHGAGTAGRTLKAMVPVSRRAADEHGGTLGNKVSLILVDLPVDEADPVTRLELIHELTGELKGSGLVDGAEMIVEIADWVTPIAAPLTRFVSRQIPMNLVITNIPGPPVPLYVMGARIERVYPYVEVIDDEGLTIAVVSYEDRLFFGITSDRDVIPDLASIAEGIEKGFLELAAAV